MNDLQLIYALYSPKTAPAALGPLELELQRIQSSPAAWSLVGPLLSTTPSPGRERENDASSSNVRFFGAATLQAKIARQWTELGPNQYDALRLSVLDWLGDCSTRIVRAVVAGSQGLPRVSGSAAGDKVVLRKLAGAVTGLSLRLHQYSHQQSQRAEDNAQAAAWDHWLLEVVARVAAPGKDASIAQQMGDTGVAIASAAAQANVLEVLSVVIEQVTRAEMVGNQR